MNTRIDQLIAAQTFAMTHRPAVGGFPFLAEVLRQAGVRYNHWVLPACQSEYVFDDGGVVQQLPSLVSEPRCVPPFDQAKLIAALRKDQAGLSTFFEFLQATWEAGVLRYSVDFSARTVTYYGLNAQYVEPYDAVDIPTFPV